MKQRVWFSVGLMLLALLLGVYQSAPVPVTQAAQTDGEVEENHFGVVLPFTGSLGEYGTAFGGH
ncbi:MAG: hypothetical protein U0401_23160 [Anaerolineae bacterium]